jgi:hypothetical protein
MDGKADTGKTKNRKEQTDTADILRTNKDFHTQERKNLNEITYFPPFKEVDSKSAAENALRQIARKHNMR